MLVIAIIIAAAGVFVAGLVLGQTILLWLAFGISLVGALFLGLLMIRRGQISLRVIGRNSANVTEAATFLHEGATSERAVIEVDAPAEGAIPLAEALDEAPPPSSSAPGQEADIPVERTAVQPAVADHPDAGGRGHLVENVHVVAGRRRFHIAGCRLLIGNKIEEISLVEACEEGFSACTTCIPDRATLARAD